MSDTKIESNSQNNPRKRIPSTDESLEKIANHLGGMRTSLYWIALTTVMTGFTYCTGKMMHDRVYVTNMPYIPANR